jgi:hypothetical protein
MTLDQLHAIPLLKIFVVPAWAVYETKSLNIMLHVSSHNIDKRVKGLAQKQLNYDLYTSIHDPSVYSKGRSYSMKKLKMNAEVLLSKNIDNTVISTIARIK